MAAAGRSVVKSHEAVIAYLQSKQLLPFVCALCYSAMKSQNAVTAYL